MHNPLVSILIPLYNAEQYIEETITKALQQTYSNIELVIVDDHSTDNSLKIAQKYISEKVHVYSNPKKGGNPARNYAFEKCNGEYIKFMDADDYCTNEMIEKQMDRMLKDGDENTLVFSPVKMLYPDGHFFLPPREIDKDYIPGIELLIDIWRGKGWNCPHCHLMHRNLFIKSGGWDETITKNQDGEFFARIANKANKALCVPDEYAIWRQTGIGVSTKKTIKAHASMIRSYEIISKLILNYNDGMEYRKICAKYIGLFVYTYYPEISPIMPMIYKVLQQIKQPLMLPDRKILIFLRTIMGWKLALKIIHKYNL